MNSKIRMADSAVEVDRLCLEGKPMDTYYAPAERANDEELAHQIDFISNNAIIDGLLHSVSGMLAVLNENRQILAVNTVLMKMLGIDKVEDVFGFRPGEAMQCVHAHEMEGGCGTGPFCSTCGAAISIVTSLATDVPVEKKCAVRVQKQNGQHDLFFNVRCVPVAYNSKRMLLLFLQDITHNQSLEAMERVFFHDINNLLNALVTASELLTLTTDNNRRDTLSQTLYRLSLRISNEISAQRCLSQSDALHYRPKLIMIRSKDIIVELDDIFSRPVAKAKKKLIFASDIHDVPLITEPSLVIRVLSNMIVNALEGTEEDEQARMWTELCDNTIAFAVWNRKAIPPDIAMRIFQRNFSTKSGPGRGLGTYSMRLFGEEVLGGKVYFTSSKEDGTVFRFSLNRDI